MKITNNFPDTVFYRFFTKDDTGFVTGLYEGLLDKNSEMEWEDFHEEVKLELKRGHIFGEFIVQAGPIFSRDDEVTLTDKGRLIKTELEYREDPGIKETYYGTSVQFFNLLDSDSAVEQSTSFSLANTITTANSEEQTQGTKHTFGIEVSGGIEKGPKEDKKKVEAAAKYQLEVMNTLVKKHSETAQKAYQSTSSYKFSAEPRKMTAALCHWKRADRTGKATRGALTYAYRIPHSFSSDIELRTFASVDAMPKELLDLWNQRKG